MSTEITFDDFLKVDIRAGRIVSAEPVPKSNKLLRLSVDFGELGTRQVLAGIAKGYGSQGENLVGRNAAFVVNLAPRTMMGLESHGMILASEVASEAKTIDGQVAVAFLADIVAPGTRLG